MKAYFLIVTTTLLLSLQGCLLPPSINEASVIEKDELRIVTSVQRAKELTLGGRLDAGERILREALRLDRRNPIILNDLGYNLHTQLRFREALDFYMEALAEDSSLIEAKLNLARLFFDIGDFEQSQLRYRDLINFYLNLEVVTQRPQFETVIKLNRALSQIHIKQGELDEGLCHSSQTFPLGAAIHPTQFAQHIRLLTKLNMTDHAIALMQGAIPTFPEGPPNYLLLDYGLLLFYHEKNDLADQVFARILAKAQNAEITNTALLFKYLLALKNNQQEEAQFIFSSLLEADPSLCKDATFDFNRYWPFGLEKKVAKQVKVGCEDA